jgi:dihydroorotase
MIGENVDIRLINPRECVRVAREHADLVVGIKVRVGQTASGANGMGPLNIAIEIADELGLPVMAHLDFGPPARAEVLAALRPGDVLTHCFRPFPNAPADARGRVREEVRAARAKGVIFDVGHGGGSFGWRTARAMLAGGFLPDCISSDVHVISIQGLAPDMLDTMSKFLCLGMGLPEIVRAATLNPANAVRRPELGRLCPGAPGDAAVLEVLNGQFRYLDVLGEALEGDKKLAARGVVLNGRWWHGNL